MPKRRDPPTAALAVCAVLLGSIGVITLTRWVLRSRPAWGINDNVFGLTPVAATCFVLLAAALVLVHRRPGVSRGLAGATALLGALSILLRRGDGPPPYHVVVTTSAALLVVALSLLVQSRLPAVACVGATVGFGTGYVSALGALYGASAPSGFTDFIGVPLYAAVGLLVASVAILLLAPPAEVVALIDNNASVRALTWRLLPVALIAPPLTGVLRLSLQRWGLVDLPLGLGLMTLTWVASMLLVWWRAVVVIDRIEHVAELDPLTGLLNRRGFAHRLEQHERILDRYGSAGALLVIDLDHLKEINDEHGHRVGDEVLVEVAQLLQYRLRGSDVLARIGGDEFVVLTPRSDGDSAYLLASLLCSVVRDHAYAAPNGVRIPLTTSIGVAVFAPGATREETLSRADRALYEAKRTGRDRVAVAPTVALDRS